MGLFPFYIERQPFDFYHIDADFLKKKRFIVS